MGGNRQTFLTRLSETIKTRGTGRDDWEEEDMALVTSKEVNRVEGAERGELLSPKILNYYPKSHARSKR